MVPLRALFPSAARGNPRAAAPARVMAGPARLPGLRSRTPTAQQHGPAQVRQPADPGAITENRHRQIRDDNGHIGNDGNGQPLTDRVRIDDIDLIRQHHHDSRSDQALTVNDHNFPRTGGHPANPEERRVPDPIPEVAPHPAETTLPPTIPLSSPAGTAPALGQAKKRRRPEPDGVLRTPSSRGAARAARPGPGAAGPAALAVRGSCGPRPSCPPGLPPCRSPAETSQIPGRPSGRRGSGPSAGPLSSGG
jgi:hypothetical protein